jgi:hypothetical protein
MTTLEKKPDISTKRYGYSVPTTVESWSWDNDRPFFSDRVSVIPVVATTDQHIYYFDDYLPSYSGSTRVSVLDVMAPITSFKALELLTRVVKYFKLPQNWDGNGAVPPTHETILKAMSFIQQSDINQLPLHFVAPGPNGEIVVEFKKENLSAEVFFDPDLAETEYVIYDGGNQEVFEHGSLDLLTQHFKQS